MPPSLLAVRLGQQEPQLLLTPAGALNLDAAREAIDLANAYGGNLDRAQEIALETCMGVAPDGLWAALTFGHAVPRQNGKGDAIQWRELYGATQLHERIAHTAHETKTAKQAFSRMDSLLRSRQDLRALVAKTIYNNGEWGFEFRSGAAIMYGTRTGGGLRGFDEIDLLVVDEAQHANDEHMAALVPTQAVSKNPQTYFAGSAGLTSSDLWWRMRLDAIKGVGEAFGWVEHTAEVVSWDGERGRVISQAPDPYDEAQWALANPAYGTRITRRVVEAEIRKMGEAKFLRERLGVWDPMPATTADAPAKLPHDQWIAPTCEIEVKVPPGGPHPHVTSGACTMAYDIHNGWSAVSIASGSLGASYVEVIQWAPGDGWLGPYLVEKYKTWRPTKIGLDGTNGPAVAALGVIREAFEEAGISTEVLEPLTSAAHKAACGGFYQAVVNGTIRRPRLPDGEDQLRTAGLKAPDRVVGNAFDWDRKAPGIPLATLESATVARALLPEKAAAEFFMY